MKLPATVVLVLSVAGLLAGCGDDQEKPTAAGPAAADAPAKPLYAPADHAGVFTGTVVFAGTPPEPRTLTVPADDVCSGHHAEGPPLDPARVVNDGGTVPNVVVWAARGPHQRFTFEAPTDRGLTVSQIGCMYEPHVFTLMVGETLRVGNDDAFIHNVHIRSARNGEHNDAQNAGQFNEYTFTRQEIGVPFGCDLHSWMSARAVVLTHPLAAVTDAGGRFRVEGLPPGEYTFKSWHETFGWSALEVTVPPSGEATGTLTLGER